MATGIAYRVFTNLYKDSVALMQAGAALRRRPGIAEASCIMATPANIAQLEAAQLSVDADVAPSDLLVVVRGEPDACEAALDAAQALLQGSPAAAAPAEGAPPAMPPTSIAEAVERSSGADLALISVPGDYAAAEAMKALSLGLHVMLFSDNVGIDEERAVKQYAEARELLVMGPDCGTAIVNGIPLGFANVVRRGDIGLVAASGTGLQEVTCRIHHRGGGVSQAIGTGGRDLHEAIGGRTMRAGLRALATDAATRVIVLISKPPAPAVAANVLAAAAESGKPVIVHFLGAPPDAVRGANLHPAHSLAEAADLAVALAQGNEVPRTSSTDSAAVDARVLEGLAPAQRTVRALFTGGTFCYEAQLAFLRRGLRCRSNAPAKGALPLDAPSGDSVSAKGALPIDARGDHVFIDLGDDEYTRGRPHPMIDPTLRNAAIRDAANDETVAVVLFDVVLGFGSHQSPADELAEALAAAQRSATARGRKLVAIGHVCGTDGDPQDRDAQIRRLVAVDAIVADSNIEAASLAAELALRLARPVVAMR
jgi:FdrA protein